MVYINNKGVEIKSWFLTSKRAIKKLFLIYRDVFNLNLQSDQTEQKTRFFLKNNGILQLGVRYVGAYSLKIISIA